MPRRFDKQSQHIERHFLAKQAAPIVLTPEELGKANRGEFEDIPNLDESSPSGIIAPRSDPINGHNRDWEIKLGMTGGDIKEPAAANEYRQHITMLATEFASENKIINEDDENEFPFPVQVVMGLGTWENDMENSIAVYVFDVDRKVIEDFLDFLGRDLVREQAFAFKPTDAPNHEIWTNPYFRPDGPPGGDDGVSQDKGRPA